MKSNFSKDWISSKKANKQRKYLYNASIHIRGKILSSMLSKELKKKYNKNSIRPRKNDKVKIMRGQFKGKTGKIEKVDIKNYKLIVDCCEVIKKDGTKTIYPIHYSNVMITELYLDDKKRFSKINSFRKDAKKEDKFEKKDEKKTEQKTVEKIKETKERKDTKEIKETKENNSSNENDKKTENTKKK